jgi:peptidoglycan/LPS O-acetylase OafA/YrhL
MLGIVICRLFLFGPRISEPIRRLIFIAGVLLVTAIFGLGASRWARADLILGPLFAAIIFGATYAKAGSALASWVFVLLGHSSYALYVLHEPLGFWWGRLSRLYPLPLSSGLYLCFILAAAVVTFLMFERPLRARLLRMAAPRPSPSNGG